MRTATALAGMVVGLLVAPAALAANYDEATMGDLSGDRTTPTLINLSPGNNTIASTSASGDLEYYRVNLPTGTRLSQIVVTAFNGGTNLSFISVQAGTTFTEPPAGTNPANLLGYTHFGNANGTTGTDILDNIGSVGGGTIGFTPPLTGSAYTFWSQETSSSPTSYALTLVVTASPVPSLGPVFAGVLALGLGLLGVRRLRRAAA